MKALAQKMSDPKITPAQRDQLMKQIQKVQEQMVAEMKKMADPSYANNWKRGSSSSAANGSSWKSRVAPSPAGCAAPRPWARKSPSPAA